MPTVGPASRCYAGASLVSDLILRHHVGEEAYSRTLRRVAEDACIDKKATSRAFRHSFAAHLLEGGADPRTALEMMSRSGVAGRVATEIPLLMRMGRI